MGATTSLKFCPRCKKDLDIGDFSLAPRRKDGLRGWCKKCYNEDNRVRPVNQESLKRRQTKYYGTIKGCLVLGALVFSVIHSYLQRSRSAQT